MYNMYPKSRYRTWPVELAYPVPASAAEHHPMALHVTDAPQMPQTRRKRRDQRPLSTVTVTSCATLTNVGQVPTARSADTRENGKPADVTESPELLHPGDGHWTLDDGSKTVLLDVSVGIVPWKPWILSFTQIKKLPFSLPHAFLYN